VRCIAESRPCVWAHRVVNTAALTATTPGPTAERKSAPSEAYERGRGAGAKPGDALKAGKAGV
jgi:hypothetical protein